MLIGNARVIARQWVEGEAASVPGYCGALFHGSVVGRTDHEELPAGSDLDLLVLIDGAMPASGGKRSFAGLLLDVTYLPAAGFASPFEILSRYQLAGSFQPSAIVADPTGALAPLCVAVAGSFADRNWVRRRCEDARDNVLRHLASSTPGDSWPAQVTSWLFGAGVTNHILLVAGLRNPTVRTRYAAVRALLEELDLLLVHEELLALLGCQHMTRAAAQVHLDVLTPAFDAAVLAKRPSFPFASDISEIGRPVAIDASQHLIDQGLHREAVFWIVATYARCLAVLHSDGQGVVQRQFDPTFNALLADLGIASVDDLERRKTDVAACLPRIWAVSEQIAHAASVDDLLM
jgi:hypothetical protein